MSFFVQRLKKYAVRLRTVMCSSVMNISWPILLVADFVLHTFLPFCDARTLAIRGIGESSIIRASTGKVSAFRFEAGTAEFGLRKNRPRIPPLSPFLHDSETPRYKPIDWRPTRLNRGQCTNGTREAQCLSRRHGPSTGPCIFRGDTLKSFTFIQLHIFIFLLHKGQASACFVCRYWSCHLRMLLPERLSFLLYLYRMFQV